MPSELFFMSSATIAHLCLLFRNNASGSTKPDPCRTLPLDQPFISDDRKTLLIAKTSIQPYLNTSSLHNERSSEVANRMLMRCVRKTDHEFLDTSGLIGGETLADGLHGANEPIFTQHLHRKRQPAILGSEAWSAHRYHQ